MKILKITSSLIARITSLFFKLKELDIYKLIHSRDHVKLYKKEVDKCKKKISFS